MERDAVVAFTVRAESRERAGAPMMITSASDVLRGALASLVTRPAPAAFNDESQDRRQALYPRALRARSLEEPYSFPLAGTAFKRPATNDGLSDPTTDA